MKVKNVLNFFIKYFTLFIKKIYIYKHITLIKTTKKKKKK
jgi:hypothetical protein